MQAQDYACFQETCAITAGANVGDQYWAYATGDVRSRIWSNSGLRLDAPNHAGSAWVSIYMVNGEFAQIGWSVDNVYTTEPGGSCAVNNPQWFVETYKPEVDPHTGAPFHYHTWLGPCGSGLSDHMYRLAATNREGETAYWEWDALVDGVAKVYIDLNYQTGTPSLRDEISCTSCLRGPDATKHEIGAQFNPAMELRSHSGATWDRTTLVPAGNHPPCPPGRFSKVVDPLGPNQIHAGTMGCGLI